MEHTHYKSWNHLQQTNLKTEENNRVKSKMKNHKQKASNEMCVCRSHTNG